MRRRSFLKSLAALALAAASGLHLPGLQSGGLIFKPRTMRVAAYGPEFFTVGIDSSRLSRPRDS